MQVHVHVHVLRALDMYGQGQRSCGHGCHGCELRRRPGRAREGEGMCMGVEVCMCMSVSVDASVGVNEDVSMDASAEGT